MNQPVSNWDDQDTDLVIDRIISSLGKALTGVTKANGYTLDLKPVRLGDIQDVDQFYREDGNAYIELKNAKTNHIRQTDNQLSVLRQMPVQWAAVVEVVVFIRGDESFDKRLNSAWADVVKKVFENLTRDGYATDQKHDPSSVLFIPEDRAVVIPLYFEYETLAHDLRKRYEGDTL